MQDHMAHTKFYLLAHVANFPMANHKAHTHFLLRAQVANFLRNVIGQAYFRHM